ncbi:MAG: aspartate kinase, partial [Arenibacter sp.]
MRVFKFGGASVKDASSVKNVVRVLEEVGHDNTLLVVSAMGKTTNAMEDIVNAYFKDKSLLPAAVHEVVQYHNNILH